MAEREDYPKKRKIIIEEEPDCSEDHWEMAENGLIKCPICSEHFNRD